MYVGTAYHGWQVQKNACHRRARRWRRPLAMVVGHPVHSVPAAAGRTPASMREVYVANFRTDLPHPGGPHALCAEHPPARGHRGDRAHWRCHEGFNAIGSCVRKEYTYRIYNSRIRNSVLCEPGLVLSQASGRSGHAGRRPRRLWAPTISPPSARVGTDVKSTVRTVHYFDVARARATWSN